MKEIRFTIDELEELQKLLEAAVSGDKRPLMKAIEDKIQKLIEQSLEEEAAGDRDGGETAAREQEAGESSEHPSCMMINDRMRRYWELTGREMGIKRGVMIYKMPNGKIVQIFPSVRSISTSVTVYHVYGSVKGTFGTKWMTEKIAAYLYRRLGEEIAREEEKHKEEKQEVNVINNNQ